MHPHDRNMNATPTWWTERHGTVAAQFAAMAAARTPDPPVLRPLAPVIALNGVRVERAARRMQAMIARKAV